MPAGRKPIFVKTKKKTQGIAERCPCPHCGKFLNFKGMLPAEGQGGGWGSYGVEKNNVVDCDHCGKKCKIINIAQVHVITLLQEF